MPFFRFVMRRLKCKLCRLCCEKVEASGTLNISLSSVKPFSKQTLIRKCLLLNDIYLGFTARQDHSTLLMPNDIREVIDKFVSFFHRIIIYGWIYIIFCHFQQQSVVNRKRTSKCQVRQTCDVTMTLVMSHVGDVVVKTLKDRCGWRILSGYKCYSTSAIIMKFSDNICT